MSDFHDDMPWSYLNRAMNHPFFQGRTIENKQKNADVDRVIGFFPNPSYGKWWLGNPPTKSCRPVPLMKKTYRWKILALQNTIKVHFEVHWGTLPRCHLKVASPWVDGSCGSVFFFLFGSAFWDEKRRLGKKRLKNCVEDFICFSFKKLELLVIWMMILVSYTYFWEKKLEKKISPKIHISSWISIFRTLQLLSSGKFRVSWLKKLGLHMSFWKHALERGFLPRIFIT